MSSQQPPPSEQDTPRFRSGAVARMLRMPVSTLRIWERRYQVAAPATTATGHRLYSAHDVQRLALLRQLSEHGHAIGSLARLGMAQLQQVASTHASTVARAGTETPTDRPALASGKAPAATGWLVVGTALVRRLERPALVTAIGQRLGLAHVPAPQTATTLAQVVAARPAPDAAPPPVGLLLWRSPSLQASALAELQAAAQAVGARRAAVVYRFASAAVRQAFADAGIALVRETDDDEALATALIALVDGGARQIGPGAAGEAAATATADAQLDWLDRVPLSPRRFDDAVLTELAGLSPTIACECPQHLAELLMQLSNFEAYSLECESRSPADAALHAHLARVAGAARALLESALQRVVTQEGLVLSR